VDTELRRVYDICAGCRRCRRSALVPGHADRLDVDADGDVEKCPRRASRKSSICYQ
jgi:hypothetical protein